MNSRYKLHLMGHQVNPFLFISKRQPHAILRAPATMRGNRIRTNAPARRLCGSVTLSARSTAQRTFRASRGVQIPLGRDFLVEGVTRSGGGGNSERSSQATAAGPNQGR